MSLIESIEQLTQEWPDYKPRSIAQPLDTRGIAELGADLAVDLPAELSSLLKKYNGLELPEEFFWKFQSSSEIVKTVQFMKRQLQNLDQEFECSPEVTSAAWSPSWIPFAKDEAGNIYLSDTGPSRLGTFGQVLYWDHEGSVRLQAGSIVEWLEKDVQNIEDGVYG